MTPLDHAIFLAYLAGIFLLGLAVSRGKQSRAEFLVADRSMRWVPIGLSVMATAFSAVNVTAFSGEVFEHGLYVLMSLPVFFLVGIPVTRWIMPFFHRHRSVSAYEFLEARFDRRVRRLGSLLFMVWRSAWMALALYATCRFLCPVTGLNLYVLIAIAGVVCTANTVAGGLRAVMWTNVAQFAVLAAALVVGVGVAARTGGGFEGIFRHACEQGLARPFVPFDPRILSPDPRVRMTLWSCLIGTFTAFLARYGVDQRVVQRYFSAASLRDARRGFWLNAFCAVFALLCLTVLGWAVHGAAAASGGPSSPAMRPIDHLAFFIRSLPSGFTGLMVAGLFASTMSNLDSGIHSCCTSVVVDFRDPGPESPGDGLAAERLWTVVFGGVVTLLACYVGRLGTIFEIANKVVNGLGSPLLALFLLGLPRRRPSPAAMLAGGALGAAASAWVSLRVQPLALHYYAVVNLAVTAGLCLACEAAVRAWRAGRNSRCRGPMGSRAGS